MRSERLILSFPLAVFFLLFLAVVPAARSADPAPAVSAPAAGAPMSDEAIDAFLKDLFQRNEKLEFFRAQIVQTKEGGVFRRPDRKSGVIQVEFPDHFLLDFSEDGLRILSDGAYAWVHDMELDEVERWRMTEESGDAVGDAAGGFALFLGGTATSVEEVRRKFRVEGSRVGAETRLLLFPLQPETAGRMARIELDIPENASLPRRVQTVGKAEEGSQRPPLVTTYTLEQVRTNLDGSAALPAGTFLFPLDPKLQVRDMNAPGGQRTVPYDELVRERKKSEEQKSSAPPPAP